MLSKGVVLSALSNLSYMSALLQIRQDARISRVEGGLEVRGVTVWDTGAYTCELEADMETHVARTHHLQVLGGSKSFCNLFIQHNHSHFS